LFYVWGQGGAPQCLAYLRELRFYPVEVCLRGERCREGCAEVSAREGLVQGERAYGAIREIDVSDSRSKCVIPIPLTGDGLECVDVRRDLTFGDIQVYVRPRAELLDYVQKGYHILYGVCDECALFCLQFAGHFETTRGDGVTLVHSRKPLD